MIDVINDFGKLPPEEAREKYHLGKDSRDWGVERAQKDLTNSGFSDKNIVKINYRPFDTRWTYYNGNSRGFQCMARAKRHFLSLKNLGFVFKRGFTENAPPCFISNTLTEFRYWSRAGMQGEIILLPYI
jgi:hypothetical protein